ncbi:alpha-2,8-polysialyltransferase family protein [bacterium 210820-DFI.6.37]|nr:alpha-2,8-polysialyltransferase family protein [bacterium 210820-DFI.6.37]
MKSFGITTYFHLMRSIAIAQTLDEKPNLYVGVDYAKITKNTLKRISETNVFNDVVGFSVEVDTLKPFFEKLKATAKYSDKQIAEVGSSLFDQYLTPYFEKVFKNADKTDDFYYFTDGVWWLKYINDCFRNLIVVEDGYCFFEKTLNADFLVGKKKFLKPFVGKWWPETNYRSPKIKKIISSCDFLGLDEKYRNKLEVIDHYQLVDSLGERYNKAIRHIFPIDIELKKGDLFLTQPLYMYNYCDRIENYLIAKKFVKDSGAKIKTIKPHPGDKILYNALKSESVIILEKNFPIEILRFSPGVYDNAITFGSSTAPDRKIAQNYKKIMTEGEAIERQIKEYVEEERLIVDVYLKIEELTEKTYLSVYSYIFPHKNIKTNLHIITNNVEQARTFLGKKQIRTIVRQYQHYKKIWDESVRKQDVSFLKNIFDGMYDYTFDFIMADSIDWDMFYVENCIDRVLISKEKPDYFLILDSLALGFRYTTAICKELEKGLPGSISCFEYFVADGKRKYCHLEWIKGCISSRLTNIIIHSAFLENIDIQTQSKYDLYCSTNSDTVLASNKSIVRAELPRKNSMLKTDDRVDILKGRLEYYKCKSIEDNLDDEKRQQYINKIVVNLIELKNEFMLSGFAVDEYHNLMMEKLKDYDYAIETLVTLQDVFADQFRREMNRQVMLKAHLYVSEMKDVDKYLNEKAIKVWDGQENLGIKSYIRRRVKKFLSQ